MLYIYNLNIASQCFIAYAALRLSSVRVRARKHTHCVVHTFT